jgi:hypothetical protein
MMMHHFTYNQSHPPHFSSCKLPSNSFKLSRIERGSPPSSLTYKEPLTLSKCKGQLLSEIWHRILQVMEGLFSSYLSTVSFQASGLLAQVNSCFFR